MAKNLLLILCSEALKKSFILCRDISYIYGKHMSLGENIHLVQKLIWHFNLVFVAEEKNLSILPKSLDSVIVQMTGD